MNPVKSKSQISVESALERSIFDVVSAFHSENISSKSNNILEEKKRSKKSKGSNDDMKV
jgi:hypothetical protein